MYIYICVVPCLQLLACEDMGISLDSLKQYASAEVRATCRRLPAEHSTEHAAWEGMPGHAIIPQQDADQVNHLALCISRSQVMYAGLSAPLTADTANPLCL